MPKDLGEAHYRYCRAAVENKDAAADRDRLALALSPEALLDGRN